MAEHDSETIENITPIVAAAKYYATLTADMAYEFGAATHTGLKRPENQDHYLVVGARAPSSCCSPTCRLSRCRCRPTKLTGWRWPMAWGAVAAAALASQLAIRTGWELAGRATSWVMKIGSLSHDELTERVEAFTHMMQQAFFDEFHTNPSFGDSGTTWSCAYFVGAFVVVFNIGDSPCFLWRNGIMCRISVDHTVEQEFMAAGVDSHIAGKYSHMLTRCLGYDSQNARPDVYHMRLQPGDQLLLCTDGLTDLVPETQIAQCVDEAASAQAACDKLISLALAAGGRDNVTARSGAGEGAFESHFVSCGAVRRHAGCK